MKDTRRTIFRWQHIGFVYQSFNLIPGRAAAGGHCKGPGQ
jgi:ABC-type lipoprotein export system ATPase subunit